MKALLDVKAILICEDGMMPRECVDPSCIHQGKHDRVLTVDYGCRRVK